MKRSLGNYARQEWARVDGLRVRLLVAPPSDEDVEGESPLVLPTLLIHGLGCSSEAWEPTVQEMANRGLCCSVVAPDLPGYGKSKGPHEAMGMEELADWCVRFLDMRGLKKVHLAGNSMGCQVALAMSRRFPDRVGGIVLQGPTTGDRLVPPWRYVVGLAADAFHEPLRYNLKLLKMYSQMGLPRYFATVPKMLSDDPLADSDKVKSPVLVIRGGLDAIVSDKIARKLAAALPDAVYVPLDTAAHAIEFNNPEDFVDSMITFLSRAEERMNIKEEDGPASCPI